MALCPLRGVFFDTQSGTVKEDILPEEIEFAANGSLWRHRGEELQVGQGCHEPREGEGNTLVFVFNPRNQVHAFKKRQVMLELQNARRLIVS